MRYALVAIDLDGTLLSADGTVSAANRAAVARAQASGALVVPCTGRAWRESVTALREIPDLSTGVFVTGAAVSDVRTGRSEDLAAIEPHLAAEVVEHLYDLPEAVLVFREAALAGREHLVAGAGRLTANTQWWFEACGAIVQHLPHPSAGDLHHTLRIGLVSTGDRLDMVVAGLKERFGDRLFTHFFQAVQMPENVERLYVLEIFAAGVDKWRGLTTIARREGIAPDRIAAIGDEINDITMIRNAACGIAMANGAEAVRHVADHVTGHHGEDGVATALDALIEGHWG